MTRGTSPRPAAALAALAAAAALGASSCWPGWSSIFDQTPSAEHRVQDLRVLAVVAEPASILLPSAFITGAAEPAPFTLKVTPAIFDPRGGDIDVVISICGARPFPQQGCATPAVALPAFSGTFPADAHKPLGPVDVSTTLRLSRAQVLELFLESGSDALGVAPADVRVVVEVARTVGGVRERESAVLGMSMQTDLFDGGIAPDERAALIAASGGSDCGDSPADCFPAADSDPVCGDGIVEAGEDCDPPTPDVCDEQCFALSPCAFSPPSACTFPPTTNAAPVLFGLRTGAHARDPGDGTVDAAAGDTLEVPVGGTLDIAPTVEADAEQFQGLVGNVGDPRQCPAGTPGLLPHLDCPTSETLSWRVYVSDGKADVVGPADATGTFTGNIFLPVEQPVTVAFAAGTAAGTKEPLAVVLGDGRGGMAIQQFTLVAR